MTGAGPDYLPDTDKPGLRPAMAGWKLPAYLTTKAIASGTFMLMSGVWLLGLAPFDRHTALVGNGVVLVFLAMTTVLQVANLERPERFLRSLTRPEWKSWLTRGAFILLGFSLVCMLWSAVELGAQLGWLPEDVALSARVPLMALGLPLAVLTAIYAVFHLRQAEGRGLWKSRLMPGHVAVQAVMAGGAVWILVLGLSNLLLSGSEVNPGRWFAAVAFVAFFAAGLIDLLLRWAGVSRRQATTKGRQGALIIRVLRERREWRLSWTIGRLACLGPATYMGLVLAWYYTESNRLRLLEIDTKDKQDALSHQLMLASGIWVILTILAAILALISLFCYESAIIKAGQEVGNA
jgi:hypothetical protein